MIIGYRGINSRNSGEVWIKQDDDTFTSVNSVKILNHSQILQDLKNGYLAPIFSTCSNKCMPTREDMMDFFRDDDKLNSLTPDDRVEIFLQVLTGSDDITKELLDQLLSDYSVDNLEIIKTK